MPQAISIHLGLNAVDPHHYQGWSGPLQGCENDARAMQAIADAQGFTSRLLLGADATRPNLLAAMDRAAAELAAHDLLLLTYSGHGTSLPDRSGDEPDQRDEAWCLHDDLLIDDEIHHRLCAFAAGVRVLVVSDSCFSGSVTRDDPTSPTTAPVRRRAVSRDGAAATVDQVDCAFTRHLGYGDQEVPCADNPVRGINYAPRARHNEHKAGALDISRLPSSL